MYQVPMNKKFLQLVMATLIGLSASYSMAGNDGCHHNCNPPQNPSGGSSANANQEQYQSTTSTSKSDSTALAGAYSGSLSGSQSNSSSKSGDSLSGAAAISGDSTSKATSGDSYAKSGDSNAVSGSDSSSHSGDSSSGSTSGSDVNINEVHEADRYPANVGMAFAQNCQTAATGSGFKFGLSVVSDSPYCNRMAQAVTYWNISETYAKACATDRGVITAGLRHKQLVASQVKGAVPVDLMEEDGEDPINCTYAQEWRDKSFDELEKAETYLDRTEVTGTISKVGADLGIVGAILKVLFFL